MGWVMNRKNESDYVNFDCILEDKKGTLVAQFKIAKQHTSLITPAKFMAQIESGENVLQLPLMKITSRLYQLENRGVIPTETLKAEKTACTMRRLYEKGAFERHADVFAKIDMNY
jgi:hypothetical protein